MKENVEDIRNWVQGDDVFVVDRGFRDYLEYLGQLGTKADMPALMTQDQKQKATEDPNASRLVTNV